MSLIGSAALTFIEFKETNRQAIKVLWQIIKVGFDQKVWVFELRIANWATDLRPSAGKRREKLWVTWATPDSPASCLINLIARIPVC